MMVKNALGCLKLAFGFALKMKMLSGIVLETKDVVDGNLSKCYDFGQKIAQELAV